MEINSFSSFQTVLPSKAIRNEKILETLMVQANSGMYRVQDSYLEACQRLQKQDSKLSSEWESFDFAFSWAIESDNSELSDVVWKKYLSCWNTIWYSVVTYQLLFDFAIIGDMTHES